MTDGLRGLVATASGRLEEPDSKQPILTLAGTATESERADTCNRDER